MEEKKDESHETNTNNTQQLFEDINPENRIQEVESMCMNCNENGITKILLTKIPFYKEIIIMNFECPHCGYSTREVQTGQSLADSGIMFEVKVISARDMSRRVVKSEYATIRIPEIDLEIPPQTQKGKLSTIEGFLLNTYESLSKALKEGVYTEIGGEEMDNKIQGVINKIDGVLKLQTLPVKFILEDPGGNSFVENPFAPNHDPYCKKMGYMTDETDKTDEHEQTVEHKTEQKLELSKDEKVESKDIKDVKEVKDVSEVKKDQKHIIKDNIEKRQFSVYKSNSNISAHLLDLTKTIDNNENLDNEAITFASDCYTCYKPGTERTCMITIPFFKELIISCFKCDNCGFKDVGIKGGGGISDKARRITLKVTKPSDLNRDLFKSESAKVSIPEMGFETSDGSMGSMYTTVEGIIEKIIDNIKNIPFGSGDSSESTDSYSNNIDKFCEKIQKLTKEQMNFTLIIDDPLSNSFIYSDVDPSLDPQLTIEDYERTEEQNDDLGITDMKV